MVKNASASYIVPGCTYDAEASQGQIHVFYSWIALQLQIGTSLGRHYNYVGPISNPRPILDSSNQTTQGNILGFL